MTCAHNHILITRSSYREAPYLFCSKCGDDAQAIEAGTDETRSGSVQSTKARSRKGCAPKEAA